MRAAAAALALVALLAACGRGREEAQRPSSPTPGATALAITATPAGAVEHARVVRVVDGDTIVVSINGREERVRYIGIDTPETVAPERPVACFGPQATEANKRLVEGKTVLLERDISERDQYGRLLRYVYVDGVFVNAQLMSEGYATSVTFPPDIRENARLRALEREALTAKRGLWGSCRRSGLLSPASTGPPTAFSGQRAV